MVIVIGFYYYYAKSVEEQGEDSPTRALTDPTSFQADIQGKIDRYNSQYDGL